ncbi:MAG: hypothetical protein ACREBE_10105 [bacterium]
MSPERTIGYFAHVRDAMAYWGALVLLTPEGDPSELFYTEPVNLNRLTHQLLGPRADAYVIERVLLRPLLEQVNGATSVVCFDDPAVLQRHLRLPVPAVVLAPPDSVHRAEAWRFQAIPDGAHAEGCWVQPDSAEIALQALADMAAGMAPFGLRDPFRQLRAAMAEIRS